MITHAELPAAHMNYSAGEMNRRFFLSVSQLNSYVDNLLYTDSFLKNVAVKGEVVDVNDKYSNLFVTLKDEESSLDCIIMDRHTIENISDLERGQVIIAVGSVGLYKKSGRFRFRINSFSLYGEGDYYIELERLKKKLQIEGIFAPEHKLALPSFPRHIGLITSSAGAVMHDVFNVAFRRDPSVRLSIFPVRVQGTEAPSDMIKAIDYYETRTDADVLIICRGGGSLMDLAPYNDENLARRIYSCRIPTVSAVGHEINYSISDLVCDLRAPTPSAAAELVVPERDEILRIISSERELELLSLVEKLGAADETVKVFDSISYAGMIDQRINRYSEQLFTYDSYISNTVKSVYNNIEAVLNSLSRQLELLNPFATLKRGYAIVKRGRDHIVSSGSLSAGDRITVMFDDGNVDASVLGEKENG